MTKPLFQLYSMSRPADIVSRFYTEKKRSMTVATLVQSSSSSGKTDTRVVVLCPTFQHNHTLNFYKKDQQQQAQKNKETNNLANFVPYSSSALPDPARFSRFATARAGHYMHILRKRV